MTVWARKRHLTYFVTIGFLIAIGIGLGYRSLDKGWTLTAKGRSYELMVADTDAARKQGLSGTDQLYFDHAMLFVFPEQKRHCMWMKDMRYSIDILWLDSSNKVTGIERNVSPKTYPDSFCHESRYVLEFAAGELGQMQVNLGDTVNLRP